MIAKTIKNSIEHITKANGKYFASYGGINSWHVVEFDLDVI